MDNKTVNTFLTVALGIIILYHLILTRLWPPLDLIYTKRMFRRFYTPAVLEKKELLPPPALRKGDRKGTLIFYIYFHSGGYYILYRYRNLEPFDSLDLFPHGA